MSFLIVSSVRQRQVGLRERRGLLCAFAPSSEFCRAGMRVLVGLLVVLNSLLFAPCSTSGAPGFLIDVWDPEAGLPDSTVTAIEQTRDGYLWAGTYNGIARFDGVQFEVFDPLNTPELVHPRVWALFLDARGVLWINTFDGSLTSYEGGRFRLEYRGTTSSDVRFSLVSSSDQEIAFGNQIGDLLRRSIGESQWDVFRPEPSPRPSLYLQSGDGQLWWHKPSQGQYGRVKDRRLESVDGPDEFQDASANFLTTDSEGRIWVGTGRGLAYWEAGQPHLLTPTNGEPELNVEFILPVGGLTNWIWAGQRLRKQSGRRWIAEVDNWRGLLGTAAGRPMGGHVDREGGVWFNHYGNGLFYISPEGEPFRWTTDNGLPGNRVGAWFEDREGNIWLGIDRGGLTRLRPAIFKVIGETQGLSARAVTSVIQDTAGDIWLATYGGGVHEWNESLLKSAVPVSQSGRFVFSLCEVQPGVVWMSAVDEDLYIFDDEGFRRAPWDVHGVKVLAKDTHDRLWAGWKNGVGYWDLRQQRAGEVQRTSDSTAVRTIATTPDGTVWFGSDAGFIYRYEDGALTRFRVEDLPLPRPVWSLSADDDGILWAGTFGGGLLRLQDGVFTRYSREQGLPDDVISQILDDGQGRLWCGSHRGLFHVSKSVLNEYARHQRSRVECVHYGRLDGLPSLEFSGGYNPSQLRAEDSGLWFATAGGLVAVHPDQVRLSSASPPVVIQEMRVDGITQPLPSARELNAHDPSPLKVPPGRRQFRFQFAALNLSSPDRVRFRHRLLGHEVEWIDAGTRREAIYSSLKPGHYEFQVTARNSEGDWNERLAAIGFDLRPRFFETLWFRGAVVVSVMIAGVFTVRRLAVRRLRRQLALAEQRHAVELDRARIARDIHDDLGAGLTEISLLSELATRDDGSKTPEYLGQISAASRDLVRAMDETVWAVNPENDTLEGLVTYASKLAQDYLGMAGLRCRLDLPAQVPDLRLEADVRHHLYLAIKESLNNIVKHSQATEATLRLRLSSGEFAIVVEDNGSGLHTTPEGDPTAAASGRLDSGHGLINLKKRLEESGGRCIVESSASHGTRIEFIVKTSPTGRNNS